MGTWERCGNTPYYRKPSGRGWFYANPLDWSQIMVGIEKDNEWAGVATVIYRKAPRFDFDVLQKGVGKIFRPENRTAILHATLEWFSDLTRLTNDKLPSTELIRAFKNAPADVRDLVLEGVGALVVGYGNSSSSITVMGIEKDSPAYEDLEDLKKVFDYAKRFYIADTIDEALDQAMAYFGIHEC